MGIEQGRILTFFDICFLLEVVDVVGGGNGVVVVILEPYIARIPFISSFGIRNFFVL